MKTEIKLLPNECFYGGAVNDGIYMPYKSGFSRDLRVWHAGNQATSALISNKGRIIYSLKPFYYEFTENSVITQGEGITLKSVGHSLKCAYKAINAIFAPKNPNFKFETPAQEMFLYPQYNTWIEMEWNCTQKKVLSYAKSILKNGFSPGVFMIDDCWSKAYGNWRFDNSKFP